MDEEQTRELKNVLTLRFNFESSVEDIMLGEYLINFHNRSKALKSLALRGLQQQEEKIDVQQLKQEIVDAVVNAIVPMISNQGVTPQHEKLLESPEPVSVPLEQQDHQELIQEKIKNLIDI